MVTDLRQAWQSVPTRRGWDFSFMKDERDPVPWDYESVVRQFLRPDDWVLDIGTGGGERLRSLADAYGSAVGIDIDPDMIEVAMEATPMALRHRISFEVMAAESLRFEPASFAVVLNRHAPFEVGQVVRVLRPGGYFITQQVGRRNMQAVFEAFGWESSGAFWDEYRRLRGKGASGVEHVIAEFHEAGCTVVACGSYDVSYYVEDVASFLYGLQSVPLPEPFDFDRHESIVQALIDQNQTERGIVSNEHRDLLIVKKNG